VETVTRFRLFGRSLWLVAAAMLALGRATAFADYRENYEKGIKAIDHNDWGRAMESLRAAVTENSVEGERVLIYGMRYKPYLPHYYLGLAYFSTGNCRAATKAWAESDRQGPVRETAEYGTLVRLRELCLGLVIRVPESTRVPDPGLLVIDALPWGVIDRVEDSAGKNWVGGAEIYTPLAIAVPPGKYSIVVTNARFPGKRLSHWVEVRSGKTGMWIGRFEPIDPKVYFETQGRRP